MMGVVKFTVKVLLSKKWRYEFITLFCIQMLCITMGILSLWKGFGVMLLLSLCGLVIMTLAEIVILCGCYRFFTYTVVEKDFYTSYIFKKRLCVLDKKKTIYYVIFSAVEGRFSRKEYIVLSNEPFLYEEKRSLRIFPWENKPLIVSYNTHKQIALPYNQETRPFLEIDKWKLVGSTGDGSVS